LISENVCCAKDLQMLKFQKCIKKWDLANFSIV
jgi:hypothetical protein